MRAQVGGHDGPSRAQVGVDLQGRVYYIAERGAQLNDLETCLCLEVSGVNRGSERRVKDRLKEKLRQAEEAVCNLPALAAVVGFKVCLIAMAELVELQGKD